MGKIFGALFILFAFFYVLWEMEYGTLSETQMRTLRATLEEYRSDPEMAACRGSLIFNEDGSLQRHRADEYFTCVEAIQKRREQRRKQAEADSEASKRR
ncbi:MAG: hypothetical protein IJD16_00080 [Desulfovibrio sp.]|nr:hypothetical protein [Desulfovibrio sp.]